MWFRTDITSENEYWYLVHCQHRKETYAANALRHILKLRVFLPESLLYLRGEEKHVPFFPGYLFIHVDLQKNPRSRINACPGVVRLVEFGGDPQTVPPYVIDTISQQLNRLNQSQKQSSPPFIPGDVVRAKYAHLRDLEMIFVGSTTSSGRVRVLLELLGRLKEVSVDVSMLEKVPETTLVSSDLHAYRKRYI